MADVVPDRIRDDHVRVEIGAGERPAAGFLAVDVNPRTAAVVASALDLPFADGSIAELRAVDVLEHISYRDTGRALAEWARVLTRGAPIYVQVPDADTIMRWYVASDRRLFAGDHRGDFLDGAEWRLLGGHLDGRYCKAGDDFRWNAHFSLWSSSTLEIALRAAGFEVESIETNAHPNLLANARRR